jgi:hypothetical protein
MDAAPARALTARAGRYCCLLQTIIKRVLVPALCAFKGQLTAASHIRDAPAGELSLGIG